MLMIMIMIIIIIVIHIANIQTYKIDMYIHTLLFSDASPNVA